MRTLWRLVFLSALGLLASRSAADAALCRGDCNGDGRVLVNELIRGLNLAMGAAPYRLCPPIDASGDGTVTVDDVVGAVDVALASCPATATLHRAPELRAAAGPLANGEGVLPNGRRLEPAGAQIPLDTFPLNLQLTPDGRHALLTNDGWGNAEGSRGLQLVDLTTRSSTRVEVPHFFGLVIAPAGDRVFVADGDGNQIHSLRFDGDTLVRDPEPFATLPPGTYPTALTISPNGSYLYVVGLLDNSVHTIEVATGAITRTGNIGNFPYSMLLTTDGSRAFVTSWGINDGVPFGLIPSPLPPIDPNQAASSSIAELQLGNPAQPGFARFVPIARSLSIDNRTVLGGSHPSAMALSPDGRFLYVTATNVDLLAVLDTTTLDLVAEVDLNVFDDAPLRDQLQGLYPNALAVAPDSRRVYVANAGINAVQVIDVDPEARTFTPAGFIPAGQYPTALALRGGTLYVANGKGAGIGPNGVDRPVYIGRLLEGSLSIIENVAAYDTAAGAAAVRRLNGFDPVEVRWVDGPPASADDVLRGNPVPIEFGSGPSDVIKHVVFILKENRTYDQIYGAFPGGNGDPRLVMFGEEITPNHQALAREFAMGDNFYCDGDVSIPGHEWTDQGNSTDFTEKLWPRNYNGNIPSEVVQFGQEGFAKGGYIFEALERQGVPFRVYGEAFAFLSRFASGIDGGGVTTTFTKVLEAFGTIDNVILLVPALINGDLQALEEGGVNLDIVQNEIWPNLRLDYSSNILPEVTDVSRAELFKTELAAFEANGTLPTFIFIWLPNDHTFGAAPGNPTPESAVADNDAGLGLVVEALSQSRFWPEMAIFVSEDDAQDGQDHVSAHRTIDLVISPWVKRGYLSPVHHSNVSMLKTMELLLGVTPRSQFDRFATDMRDYFTVEPDFTPYTARPLQVAMRRNPSAEAAPNAYLKRAAVLSEELDLEMYDEAGESLSQVLWLVHAGGQVERRKATAAAMAALFCCTLIAAGILFGRRLASRPE